MDTTTLALIELGAVFFGLGVLGRLAARIGMSPIPFYLISGLRRSRMAGLLDLALNAVPGAAIALILGLGPIGAFVLAGVTYISSSGIVAKVLADLGRLGNRETPVVLSILVFEDLAMAVYLPILTAILAGVSLLGGLEAVAISLGLVTVVLVLVVRHGRYVSVVLDSPDRETLLLKLLGAALLVAGIASALQVSAAVGAFLLGIAISGSTAHNAVRVLEPLRDLFAAIFFVFFGLNTDPTAIPPVLGWAILLAVLTALTKLVTGWIAAARHGIAVMGRARAGAALIARGEFSIVIAGLAVASGHVDSRLAAIASAYVMITAVLGPVAARVVEPVMRFASTRLPGGDERQRLPGDEPELL